MSKKKKDQTLADEKTVETDETVINEANAAEAADAQTSDDKSEYAQESDTQESGVEELKAEIQNLNDRYLRLNAEFQNYRKRVEKEKTDIFKYGNEKLIIEMLPIMDNFERALSSFEEDHAEDKVLNGVKMIKKSLDDFFDKHEVKKIEAINTPFDPDKHHAVMTEEVEGVEGETVVAVFQEGYLLGDKVIRPSMVKVSN